MQASLTILLFAVCLVCGTVGFGGYQAKIPNGDNVMRNGQRWPGVGHVRSQGGPSDKNPFGIAFATAGFEWTQELCQQDSDGDGQSNGFELGDPACSWTAGSTPQRSSDISHPGFSDSVVAPSFPAVTTTLVTTSTTASAVRALSHNTTTTTPGACDFVVAELYRRQLLYFGSEMPFSEAESETHTPFIIVSGKAATVTVGNATLHPMTASNDSGVVHWITHIFVQDQEGRTLFVKMLAPITSNHAEVSFDIPTGVTALVAYAFCNKHGLYASPPVACVDSYAVAAVVAVATTTTCMVDTAAISTTVDLSSPNGQMLAQTLVAEMHRRQLSLFEASTPFTEEMSIKHAPYILLGGSEAVVFVGKGALTGNAADIHPMSASSSPFIVHFVNFVYVLDEDGVVIAMTPKSPDDPAPATLNFSVPVGINYATAYEFCNQHGLYRGPTIRVGAYRGGGVDLFAKDEDKDDDQVIEVLGLELDLALLMAVGGATSAALFCTCLAVCCICHRHRVWTDKKVESALEPGSTAKVQEIVEAPRPALLGDLASDYGDVLDALSPSRLECAIKIVTALHGGQTPKGLTPKHANFQAA